jgi:cell division protein FtsW
VSEAPSVWRSGWRAQWERLTAGHDRGVLAAAAALFAAGMVLALAAGPGAAAQLHLDSSFQLALRHALYAGAALAAAVACASFTPRLVRRFGVMLWAASLVALVVVAVFGVEKKGAQRWLEIAGFSVQPSEFAKPALVIACAWMLAERMRNPRFPGLIATTILFAIFAALVAPQPDLGQTVLMAAVVLSVLALSRVELRIVALGVGVAVAVAAAGYGAFGHVRERVDGFFAREVAANSQVGMALEALAHGGVFGRGLGEGQVKLDLPDAHADFIFAVAAEELGAIGALGLIGVYAALIWLGLQRAAQTSDPFARLAASGLFILIGLQALIHIGVNVAVVPAKGMTLPFVSYGGSSLLASAVTLGLALALVRVRQPAIFHDRAGGTKFS